MRTAYLILAHDNPRHLARLVRALKWPGADILIHLDAKTRDKAFRELRGVPGVDFCSRRIPVYWGDFSQVEAILQLLRESRERERYDRYVLLSGADYPVQPMGYVHEFLAQHSKTEFITMLEMPFPAAGKLLSLLTVHRHRPTDSFGRRILHDVLVGVGVRPKVRDLEASLGGLKPFGGSSWWALTGEAVEHVLDFVETQPDVVRFFHNTTCPDEAFFQTVLANSPFLERSRRNLTYADWSGGGDNPAYVTGQHLELFRPSGPLVQEDTEGRGEYLFARKFSDDRAEIVDELDRIVAVKE